MASLDGVVAVAAAVGAGIAQLQDESAIYHWLVRRVRLKVTT